MPNSNQVRKPQQKRSIEKKEKILDAGYRLFDKNGYYKTSTPEIAAEAGVSIGCLYSYFKDKHEIFMELFERHNDSFESLHKKLEQNFLSESKGPETCLREFIVDMIKIHESAKGFHRELNVLYYSDPIIRKRRDEQTIKIQKIALRLINKFSSISSVDDKEAAAVVTTDIISAIVDRVSFFENPLGRERIINEGAKAICRYLTVK